MLSTTTANAQNAWWVVQHFPSINSEKLFFLQNKVCQHIVSPSFEVESFIQFPSCDLKNLPLQRNEPTDQLRKWMKIFHQTKGLTELAHPLSMKMCDAF